MQGSGVFYFEATKFMWVVDNPGQVNGGNTTQGRTQSSTHYFLSHPLVRFNHKEVRGIQSSEE